jgi:hypothetical protein
MKRQKRRGGAMRHKSMVSIIFLTSVLTATAIGTSVLSQTKTRGGVNLVKEEMLALDRRISNERY